MMTERNTDPNGENDVEGHLFPHKATEDAPAPGAEPEVAEHGAKGGRHAPGPAK